MAIRVSTSSILGIGSQTENLPNIAFDVDNFTLTDATERISITSQSSSPQAGGIALKNNQIYDCSFSMPFNTANMALLQDSLFKAPIVTTPVELTEGSDLVQRYQRDFTESIDLPLLFKFYVETSTEGQLIAITGAVSSMTISQDESGHATMSVEVMGQSVDQVNNGIKLPFPVGQTPVINNLKLQIKENSNENYHNISELTSMSLSMSNNMTRKVINNGYILIPALSNHSISLGLIRREDDPQVLAELKNESVDVIVTMGRGNIGFETDKANYDTMEVTASTYVSSYGVEYPMSSNDVVMENLELMVQGNATTPIEIKTSSPSNAV